MAQQLLVALIDDIDGGDAEETVEFGLDGVTYQIDLSVDHAEDLRGILGAYVDNGRKVRKGARRSRSLPTTPPPLVSSKAPVDREQNQAIRRWARKNGFAVSDRGRIRIEVVEAFHARRK